jgi:hypothetical protein
MMVSDVLLDYSYWWDSLHDYVHYYQLIEFCQLNYLKTK